jgi:hypothetical protein
LNGLRLGVGGLALWRSCVIEGAWRRVYPKGVAAVTEQAHQARPPVLVLAEFVIGPPPNDPGLNVFIDAVKTAGVPPSVPTYVGTYGLNRKTADAVTGVPSGVYAPLFGIQPQPTSAAAYAGRKLKDEQNALLNPRYARPIPLAVAAKPLPARDHLNWGRELGRRFRDQIRRARQAGEPIATTWQFDEILREVVEGPNSVGHQRYATGILDGLRLGRPVLGDKSQQGIIWAARSTLLPLPSLPAPMGSVIARLWAAINKAALFYVGEEYMDFDGDAAKAATVNAAGQRRLLAAGPIRHRIGMKYVAGMTPGYIPNDSSLGGNVHNWPPSKVNAWLKRYVVVRRSQTPLAGFAQFNFTGTNANARPQIVTDAVRTAVAGIAAEGPAIT